jgi:NAD(P)-dependent dehydrogenase (short-subunit alcohol dehydrogenase family)
MKKGTYNGAAAAVIKGIKDMFKAGEPFGKADDGIDMTGKTCMITGANSGLGYAAALRLATMGAAIIMAGRSQIPLAGDKLKKITGSSTITMEYIDLARLSTVADLARRLKARDVVLDVLVCNAGVVTGKSRLTPDGYDTMFQVNYLAKFHLVNTLIKEGILKTGKNKDNTPLPRVIFVSSEYHRTEWQVNIPTLGKPIEYTMKDSMAYYGYTKFLLTLFARELARRYKGDSIPRLSVFTLCPGPVATNIAREAPKIFQPLIKLIFFLFFRKPIKASDPIVFFASGPSVSGKTDMYLHVMVKKNPDPRTGDPETGRMLWEKSKELVESAGTVAGKPGPA